jgi:hypothetical protein
MKLRHNNNIKTANQIIKKKMEEEERVRERDKTLFPAPSPR